MPRPHPMKIIVFIVAMAVCWLLCVIFGCATTADIESVHTEMAAMKIVQNEKTEIGDVKIDGSVVALCLAVVAMFLLAAGWYPTYRKVRGGRIGPSISREERANGELGRS